MNEPNAAFKRKKNKKTTTLATSGFHIWECMECGWKQNIWGSYDEGYDWLNNNSTCHNCGKSNPGWECLSK